MSDTPDPVDQPTLAPTQKWVAGVGTGSSVLALVWIAGLLGVDLTPETAGALVLLAGGAAAWLRRNRAVVLDALDRDGNGAHHDVDGDGLADR